MDEGVNSNSDQTNCEDSEPNSHVSIEVEHQATIHGENAEQIAKGETEQGHTKGGKAFELFRRLTISEWLTFLVGVGSLVISYLTYRTASDTTDIKSAIGNLSDLAQQTKRQAEALTGQLSAIRDQVGALKEQTEEFKLQTKAISSQTEAIRASSDAAIKAANAAMASSDAQKRMADATTEAQKAIPDLFELEITGLRGQADDNGLVHPTLTWKFRNVGGSSFIAKSVHWGIIVGNELPQSMPTGGVITPGNDTAVINNNVTSIVGLNEIYLNMAPATLNKILSGSDKMFFFAKITYLDTLKVEHSHCFGRVFVFKDDYSVGTTPSGGAAYQCAE